MRKVFKKMPQSNFKLISISLLFLLFVYHQMIFADRGSIEQSEPLPSPTQNFPGYFDTNVVSDKHFRFNLPLGSIDFGATENFSVGMNLPLIFYMVDTWRPAFALNARYRFFSNKKLSSALSVYGGYFNYKNSHEKINLYFINATYNNSITINENNVISTQVNALKGEYKNRVLDSTKYKKKSLNAIAIALGHTYIIDPKWSMQNTIGVPVLMNFLEEDENSSGIVSFKHIRNYPFFYRLLFGWRVTPNSLITFGGFLITQTDINLIILPWFDWSVIL